MTFKEAKEAYFKLNRTFQQVVLDDYEKLKVHYAKSFQGRDVVERAFAQAVQLLQSTLYS